MAGYALPPLGQTSLSSNYVVALGDAINYQWHLNRAPIGTVDISGVAMEGGRLLAGSIFRIRMAYRRSHSDTSGLPVILPLLVLQPTVWC